jgi:hypothetical protein
VNTTTRAIFASAMFVFAIFGIAQLALLFYSISHPSIRKWVTVSFLISIVLYPTIVMVVTCHGKWISAWKEHSTESPADSH